MRIVTLIALILLNVSVTPAGGQVLTPREAFGGTTPKLGVPGFYATPMSPTPYHGSNCSPSRASTVFSKAIGTGAARVWAIPHGTDTYAVIWRRGQSSYRAVQLIENRYGKVGQKTIGKHLYRTIDEAVDAVADYADKNVKLPPSFELAQRQTRR